MDTLPVDTCGRRRYLLLLYLFVLEAAADCPGPMEWKNIVLTNEALLLNEFPEGSDLTLECANGYVKESGSEVISCNDGSWTEPDLICKKRDCGRPNPEPNMSFNTSAGTLFGAIIKVVCEKGYKIRGSSYKQCYSSGWSGKARCQIVTCRKPEVANGRSLWNSSDDPKYGQKVEFTCNEGYTLTGEKTVVCSQTGAYNPPPPECTGITTEDRFTTEVVTPTPATTAQAVSTSTASSSATSTAHRDKSIATSAATTVSTSARGARDILTAEDKATTASTRSVTTTATSFFQDKYDEDVNTTDVGYLPVIVSVICVSLAVFIILFFLHKFLLRRKGSYDTREDLKPELLQFQNL